ncbi:RsmB/NOP family class I SAM-dependent RNA methyltransferase [Hasllibacter sp. MH4015]|uniref:RsmB/NOP family class I SAM-dependent RNA methyltransferase n=1 Tax=Hasllibacter sp. MH4015 TaxID=2854029 RepID=UPI001CD6347A|nr:RsmB/NOP family class I SAM-dependent RNA methyltransferase [Hasllibacter sp. MH4015]
MTPGARLSAAMEVLDAWLSGQPVEKALTTWARGARYAGSKDRAAVRDHVYDVLRQKASCAAAGGAETGRGLILGLRRLQGQDLSRLFTGEGHAPAPLRPEEAAVSPQPHDPERDIPDWARGLLAARAPDMAAELFASFAHRAPVWLRVNLSRISRDGAADALAQDGILTEAHGEVLTALEVTENARRVKLSDAYTGGLVELQDLSVQAAIARVDWPDGGRILDYCAGGGGKSLAIADRVRAELFAHDANPRRMVDLGPRAARAGVEIATVEGADLTSRAPYDAVLADVPCSGSGTWRRDPEAKWRTTPDDVAALTKVQDEILDAAAALTGPGGQLVYMTCSLFEAENEARIAAFYARDPRWSIVFQHLDLPLTASDGFFTCVLRRA